MLDEFPRGDPAFFGAAVPQEGMGCSKNGEC